MNTLHRLAALFSAIVLAAACEAPRYSQGLGLGRGRLTRRLPSTLSPIRAPNCVVGAG